MNTKRTSQDDARRGTPCGQAGTGSADAQSAEEAGAHGDAHAMTQAARSVMHPEHHELEWRFYHGAIQS
jgi:hypothetical protein